MDEEDWFATLADWQNQDDSEEDHEEEEDEEMEEDEM